MKSFFLISLAFSLHFSLFSQSNNLNKISTGYFKIKAVTGFANSKEIKATNEFYTVSTDLNPPKNGFRIGVEAEYIIPNNKNKWSLFFETALNKITYSNYKTNGISIEGTSNNLYFIFGGRHYMYLNNDVAFSLNANLMLRTSINSNLLINNNNYKESNELKLGFGTGFGLKWKNVNLEYRLSTLSNGVLISYAFLESKK